MKIRFKHIAWSLVVLAALVVGGIWFYLFPLGGVEDIAVDMVEDALGPNSPIVVEVDEIDGSVAHGLILKGVRVRWVDSTHDVTLLTATQLSATYSLRDLLRGAYTFDDLVCDSLCLTVIQDSLGRWLAPLPLAGPADSTDRRSTASGAESAAPAVSIASLILNNAEVTILRHGKEDIVVEDIGLQASLEVNQGTYAAEIRKLDFLSRNFPLASSLEGKVTYSNGAIVYQDLQISRGVSRFKVSGTLNIKELSGSAELSADQVDLADITALTGGGLKGLIDLNGRVAFSKDRVAGRVHIGGNFLFVDIGNLFADFRFADKHLEFDTLYGTIMGECSVDGTAEVDFSTKPETYTLFADIRNFDLEQLVPGSFKSNLSGSIAMDGRSFKNDDLLLAVEADLYESAFDEYPLQLASGRIVITTDSLWFPEPFQINYFENEFYTHGLVTYTDTMHLEIEADLKNLDRYRGRLFINEPGGRGKARATVSGKTNDPDLSGWFASDSLWVYGLFADTCYAEYDISRFLTGRRGQVVVDLNDGAAWAVPFDTAHALIALDSMLVRIDTVGMHNPYASAGGRAVLDQGVYPWSLTLDTLDLTVLERTFHNQGRPLIEIDTFGFDLKNATIGKDAVGLTADGRINYDESMNLALNVRDVPIASWLKLLDQPLELDGKLSGEAELHGTLLNPEFTVRAGVDSIIYQGINLGDLYVDAVYEHKLITIESLTVTSAAGHYRANGSLHANLSFTGDEFERLPDEPLDISLTASDTRFDLVPLMLPSVEDLEGNLMADIHLFGTPGRPQLSGQAVLKDGRLKYLDLEDLVHVDSMSLQLINNRVEFDSIRAYVNDDKRKRRAYVVIDGALTVKTLDTLHYDIDVTIPEPMPFKYELDDIQGIVLGLLHIDGNTPPRVEGDLTLQELEYKAEFATEEQGSPIMTALSGEDLWDLDINILLPSNYWIKNQDIDAEFSGFINLIRERGRYRFVGELEILRGRGYLFDKTFRIQEGSVVVFEDIEYPNPRLDITATTRIPVAAYFEEEEERSQVELTLQVTGTLENPELGIADESGSGFTREDILPLIVANYYGAESGSGGQFEARLSQLVSAQASQILSQRLGSIGVEDFEIDPTTQGEFDLSTASVSAGWRPSDVLAPLPDIYVYGKTQVSSLKQGQQEYGFEYRFSTMLLLEGKRDEDKQARERYQVNLKLNLEF